MDAPNYGRYHMPTLPIPLATTTPLTTRAMLLWIDHQSTLLVFIAAPFKPATPLPKKHFVR